ncbi:hypothetical protein [Tunturiibacter lichenicola]|uniref:hypothetical protein n=1 Tax=Tunturiibacter lichenicola TaxID=2051959 RepID=UPI0021B4B40F|nr:hypothetical protein [Edaphobacter lichenicola]
MGANVGAVGGSRGVEALAAAGAANRAEGEEIEEPILEAATMGAMEGLSIAERAEPFVCEYGLFGKHGDLIGCGCGRFSFGVN